MKSISTTYPKAEKLKSKKRIDLLFSEGYSVTHYPFRLVVLEYSLPKGMINFGVSVGKKNFKRAVDRNFLKRRMRECYRLNKEPLFKKLGTPHLCMLLYIGSKKIPFIEMQKKYIELVQKVKT